MLYDMGLEEDTEPITPSSTYVPLPPQPPLPMANQHLFKNQQQYGLCPFKHPCHHKYMWLQQPKCQYHWMTDWWVLWPNSHWSNWGMKWSWNMPPLLRIWRWCTCPLHPTKCFWRRIGSAMLESYHFSHSWTHVCREVISSLPSKHAAKYTSSKDMTLVLLSTWGTDHQSELCGHVISWWFEESLVIIEGLRSG